MLPFVVPATVTPVVTVALSPAIASGTLKYDRPLPPMIAGDCSTPLTNWVDPKGSVML
jgi:hypothetical protein